jgi:hypothetical protein
MASMRLRIAVREPASMVLVDVFPGDTRYSASVAGRKPTG